MKQTWGAPTRNGQPIAEVLLSKLPPTGTLLEIASGTGQHAAHIAPQLPDWTWHPTELDESLLSSIAAWTESLPNVTPPSQLNVQHSKWHESPCANAIFCANMIHIAPWAAAEGLFYGAAKLLSPGELLILYGPFILPGQETAPSNLDFDQSLRQRNPSWGIRNLDDLCGLSQRLVHQETIPMPANNYTVVFQRE